MRILRFTAAIVVAFVLAHILYFLVLLVAPFDPTRAKVNRIGRIWTGAWKRILGIRVHIQGEENIRDGGPYLFVSNHVSYLDVLALYNDFPIQLRFLAKKTLVWVPVFGIAFHTLDHVYIDRRKSSAQRGRLELMAEKYHQGKSICIFPGGRRAADGRLGEWKKGAFVLATRYHIPVAPVGIVGSAALHGIGDIFPRPGHITIRIGRPISTEKMTYEDRDTLLRQTQDAVRELIEHDTHE